MVKIQQKFSNKKTHTCSVYRNTQKSRKKIHGDTSHGNIIKATTAQNKFGNAL